MGYFPINNLMTDSLGNVWLCGPGIVKYDGHTYTQLNVTLPNGGISSMAFDLNGDQWIGTAGGVVKYASGRSTIYSPQNSLLPDYQVTAIAVDHDGNKWFGTMKGALTKYDGKTWTWYDKYNSELKSDAVASIAIEKNGTKWIGTFDQGLAKFDDTSWTIYNTSNSGLPENLIRVIEIDPQGNKWIGTGKNGLVKFDGTNWKAYNIFNSGIAGNSINSIDIDKLGNKWIATETGLSAFNEAGVNLTDIKPNKQVVPGHFSLEQNYPNPFNPSTKISYTIPEGKFVRLKIYDMLGKEISTLVDEYKEAGSYTLQFDASLLPSGVYIYRIQAGEFIYSRKLMLLK